MPKVKCYSAAWLSKNAPGHQLFEPSPEAARSRALTSPYASKKKAVQGPRRTIARRGTEVFVAVGKEIRWGDLAYIKEAWASTQTRDRRGSSARVKREDSNVNMDDIPDIEAVGGLRVSGTNQKVLGLPTNELCQDNQGPGRRRHSTTHHLPQHEPPRYSHNAHYPHLHDTRLPAPNERRCCPAEAQDLYTWSHHPCHIAIAHHVSSLASAGR